MQAAAVVSSQPSQLSHSSQPPTTWTKSLRFSFSDGNLWLRTKDTLYHVHRYLFMRHSHKFNELVIASACLYSDGSQPGNPIILREVDTRDFDELLSVLYPTDHHPCTSKSVEQWLSVLSLGTRWYFESIRQLAIDNLSGAISAVDKILLGRRFEIEQWLVEGYTALCCRELPPSLEEGKTLGMEDVIKIVHVRHRIASSSDNLPPKNLMEEFRARPSRSCLNS